MEHKKAFCLLSPGFRDEQLTKAEGIIPYVMQKHLGYQAIYALLKPTEGTLEFPSLATFTEPVIFDWITPTFPYQASEGLYKSFNNSLEHLTSCSQDLFNYIEEKAHQIDVLYLSGFYSYSFAAAIRYKELNPNGKLYLKLDANLVWVNKTPVDDTFLRFLKACDLITGETRLVNYINKKWPVPVHYLPNGYYSFAKSKQVQDANIPYSIKENIILTVGRLGTWQKATEVLLKAFLLAVPKLENTWKLVLIGTVEPEFQAVIDKFFISRPTLQDRVIFTGFISEKDSLSSWYKKAKIFVLPSRIEALANVYLEAKANGCYLVVSDIDSGRDAVDTPQPWFDSMPTTLGQQGDYGSFFTVDDTVALADRLVEACNDEERLRSVCDATQEDVKKRFDWITLCHKIDVLLSIANAITMSH